MHPCLCPGLGYIWEYDRTTSGKMRKWLQPVFLDRLTPGDQAALIAFSDSVNPDPSELNPEREVGFTSNLTPVYDMIENLQAQGGTHLYNAVKGC
jgi:hypothetical protein